MKLQVLVSDEMNQKIEFYAKKMGISKSALCCSFIGEGILGYDKAYEIMERTLTKETDENK